MSWPPPYPRVPYLPPSPAGARDDLVLEEATARRLLAEPVVVEEKLDGANVMLWNADRRVQVATRGGPGARDRAAQLGPLRAWAAAHVAQLESLLADDRVLYAEWLWLTHTVAYDSLPCHLIAFDLYSSQAGFAQVAERDRALDHVALVRPPTVFAGVLRGREHLDELLGVSRFGSEAAEGLIVRAADPDEAVPRVAKAVLHTFTPRSDESWGRALERNAVSSAPRLDIN